MTTQPDRGERSLTRCHQRIERERKATRRKRGRPSKASAFIIKEQAHYTRDQVELINTQLVQMSHWSGVSVFW